MKLEKIVKNNKHEGLRLTINKKQFEFFTLNDRKENISVKYIYLMSPLKTLTLMTAYANDKGDFWRNEEGKNEYIKFTKKGITLGKLYLSMSQIPR